MKQSIGTWLSLLSLLLLTGCWDQVELTERGFVMAVAIDLNKEGKVELTTQIYKPLQVSTSGSIQPTDAYFNLKNVQDSVFEAVRDIPTLLGRRAQWSHQRIVLISDAYVQKRGLRDVLDFFNRDHEPRMSSNLFVTEGKASAFLEEKPLVESTTGQQLKRIQEAAAQYSGKTMKMNLLDMNLMLRNKTGHAVAPYIGLMQADDAPFAVKGVVLLDDGKMVGALSPNRTEYLLMLMNKYHYAIIQTPCGGTDELNAGGLNNSIEVVQSQAKLASDYAAGVLHATVTVNITGSLAEAHCADVTTAEKEARFIVETEDRVQTNLEAVVQELQTKKLDVLGFGDQVYRSNPSLWKSLESDWGEHFQRARFTYDVKLTLLDTGMHAGKQMQVQ